MTQDAEATIGRILNSAAFARAAATLEAEHDRTVADIIALTETPAPPFQEAERAQLWRGMAVAHGLADVATDEEGNVTGLRRGVGGGGNALVAVAAHLDTVFPAGTDVRVRREGNRLFAPGIGDDTRSLAVLLAWQRAMDAAGIRTRSDILFVADVGEEGAGDLRGMRHLFLHGPYKDRIGAFITVDSPDMAEIATGGIGSRRYRVTFTGPGGHSYGAFGLVNPMFAMADAIHAMGQMQVPTSPKTTYSASRTGGGTSINAIPDSVWLEVDLRSESAEELDRLEARFHAVVAAAAAAENQARSTRNGRIGVTTTRIGDRPAGRTDTGTDLVRFAAAAIAAHGTLPSFEASSTDANIPMSLGIPAIKIGSGGSGGRAHSLEEWIDVTPEASLNGMRAGLATLLAAAGMVDE
jgi:acetylornithine deacetylase/succinyl-diaminopimelate desuccinylase-like protein